MSTQATLEYTAVLSHSTRATRTFAAACAVNFGAMISFYLLFPVAPLLAARSADGTAAAGEATGALMLATLIAEVASAPLQRRAPPALLLAAGLILMGAPALLMSGASSGVLIGLCAARGLGMGLLLVSGGAAVADALAPGRRSRGMALFGGLSSLSGLVALPAGPWLLERLGPASIAQLGGASALIVLPLAFLVTSPSRTCRVGAGVGASQLLRPQVLAPALGLLGAAAASGICTSVLPLVRPWAHAETIALALLTNAGAALFTRCATGWATKATAQKHALGAGVALSAVALAAVGLSQDAIQLCLAMGLLGAAFGLVQNPSFLLILARTPQGAAGAASALWNLAYDAGLGLGAVVFGLAANRFQPAPILLAVAAATALLLPFVIRPARPATA